MMFSLEARTPFLDTEVFKVASTLPYRLKINKNCNKVALREAAKSAIPNESYNRRKLGFPVPLREWVKEDDLYNEIKEKFNSEIAHKFFDVNRINKILDKHKTGKADCFKKVWNIYTFIIWYEQYFGVEEEA